jgi:probable HAF family extracellular repeat protein
LLLRIADTEHLDVARQLLHAHEYLRMKQFAFDLVILNERATSYVQDLQIGLETLVRQSRALPHDGEGPLGRVFVIRADLISPEACALLVSVARAVFLGQRGRLSDQLDRVVDRRISPRVSSKRSVPASGAIVAQPLPSLEFFNGLGGFAKNGTEYVTILGPGQSTPAPWINVVANSGFGFQVSAEGAGTTWSLNSGENRLTPWSNDAVTDRLGEAFYICDNDTGDLWCPTALPIRNEAGQVVGYSQTVSGPWHAFLWEDVNGNGQSEPGEMIDRTELHDGAVAEYGFHAEHVVGGHTIFERVGAAGVLGDVPADGAGGLARRIRGVVEPVRAGRVGHPLVHHTRLGHQPSVADVDRLDLRQATGAHHDRRLDRERPARQARAGAAGHEGDPFGSEQAQHRREAR